MDGEGGKRGDRKEGGLTVVLSKVLEKRKEEKKGKKPLPSSFFGTGVVFVER